MGAGTDGGVRIGGKVKAGSATAAQTGSSFVLLLELHPGVDE